MKTIEWTRDYKIGGEIQPFINSLIDKGNEIVSVIPLVYIQLHHDFTTKQILNVAIIVVKTPKTI